MKKRPLGKLTYTSAPNATPPSPPVMSPEVPTPSSPSELCELFEKPFIVEGEGVTVGKMLCSPIRDWPSSKGTRTKVWAQMHQNAALDVKAATEKAKQLNQTLENRWKQYVGCFCTPHISPELIGQLNLVKLESRASEYRRACKALATETGETLQTSWWWSTMRDFLGRSRQADSMLADD